ncbi:MAG: tricarballylate utilization 4Fe-4S protein TcuB [Burkholderiaceae bacterium]
MSTLELNRLVSAAQEEVARQMVVCNACRYCEGLCAVFPAMELRTEFTGGDVDYLANLCHNCSACYYDCQYAPPHEFSINVPKAMSELREQSYARYAWPQAMAGFFEANGLKIAVLTALACAIFIAAFVFWSDSAALFASGSEEGAFYRVMPHNTMVLVFGSAFGYAIFAIGMSIRRFWFSAGPVRKLTLADFWQATSDAGKLRYLDGGGMGCMNEDQDPSNRRRLYHHLTFYGFLLCFAATSTATVLHYVLGWQAPYPWWSPTVLLGVFGGIGLVIGPIGLLRVAADRDAALNPDAPTGMGAAFLWMLMLVSLTGLLLLVVRATPLMGLTLAVHLGFVLALFLTMPYGKFVHGIYRFTALVRHAHEQNARHG